ncbi:hypothetical protein GGC65_004349 [Sphingopyxis sp. OAS728]|nr:hypothetical protein [Sphingopyxis sp. OAS728]
MSAVKVPRDCERCLRMRWSRMGPLDKFHRDAETELAFLRTRAADTHAGNVVVPADMDRE